jgi:chaperone BCS1
VPDSFGGAQLWWEHYEFASMAMMAATQHHPQQHQHHHHHQQLLAGFFRHGGGWRMAAAAEHDRRSNVYVLKLRREDKDRILGPYMEHILAKAREARRNARERLLFTNTARGSTTGDVSSYLMSHHRHVWDSVPFKHPSTFDTIALDPRLKRLLIDDLEAFARGGEGFYRRTGRAWKRGYLLHGPPGTGKSSLIAAMANLLRYDVYDLELTHVRSNAELRRLLLRTTSKSIVVIEDIDCSLELTTTAGGGGATAKPKPDPHPHPRNNSMLKDDALHHQQLHHHHQQLHHHHQQLHVHGAGFMMMGAPAPFSAITLSGLLNFTDGLWSCCGDERIFVFTTNHVESLDPALLRPGRMDMHILMSYCTFPAFKILTSNYLGIRLEDEEHHRGLYAAIEEAMEKHDITPAEVSEVFIRNKDKPPAVALEELLAQLLAHPNKNPTAPSAAAAADDRIDDDHAHHHDGDEGDGDDDSILDVQELVKQAIHPTEDSNSTRGMNGHDGDGGARDGDDGWSIGGPKKSGVYHNAGTAGILTVVSSKASGDRATVDDSPSSNHVSCTHCNNRSVDHPL